MLDAIHNIKKITRMRLAVVFFAALLFVSHHTAHAQLFFPSIPIPGASTIVSNLGQSILGTVVNFLLAFVGLIATTIIGFEAWVVAILLQINNSVVNAAPVYFGFPVTVSIVNLGFVLALVVIAIATMFRMQSYGMKQTLWRLVVAAVLVNFSLVIAGTIINFAGSLANYFMTALPFQGGGFWNFSSALVDAFAPQQLIIPEAAGAGAGAGAVGGSFLGGLIAPLGSIIFSSLGFLAIIVVMGVFCAMLVARYVWLTMLLVLMPFIWLLYIFPFSRSLFSRWWSHFIRWTFFAPIVLFFLWLVIKTGEATGSQSAFSALPGGKIPAFASTSSNDVIAAISSFVGNLTVPIFATLMNNLVILGLTVGGLYAANKLSISFASVGVNAVTGMAKWTGNRAFRYTRRGGARIIERTGAPQKLRDAFQRRVDTTDKKGGALMWAKLRNRASAVADYSTSLAGRGLDTVRSSGRESLVKEGSQDVSKMSVQELIQGFSTLRIEQQFAAMERIGREGRLHEIPAKKLPAKGEYDRFNQQKLYKKFTRATLGAATESSQSASGAVQQGAAAEQKKVSVAREELKKQNGRIDPKKEAAALEKIAAAERLIAKAEEDFKNYKENGGTDQARITELRKIIGDAGVEKDALRKKDATVEAILQRNGAQKELDAAQKALAEKREAITVSDYKRDRQGNFVDANENIIEDPWGKDREKLVKEDGVNAMDVLRWETGKILSGLTSDQQRDIEESVYKSYERAKPYLGLEEAGFEAVHSAVSQKTAEEQPGIINRVASKLNDEDYQDFAANVVNEAFGVGRGDVITALGETAEQSLRSAKGVEKLVEALKQSRPDIAKAIASSGGLRLTGFADLAKEVAKEDSSTPPTP